MLKPLYPVEIAVNPKGIAIISKGVQIANAEPRIAFMTPSYPLNAFGTPRLESPTDQSLVVYDYDDVLRIAIMHVDAGCTPPFLVAIAGRVPMRIRRALFRIEDTRLQWGRPRGSAEET